MAANFLLHTEDDIAMIYEGLGRTAFNCGKAKDPFGIACQEDYSEFVPSPTEQGKRNLSTVLGKFVIDFPDHELSDRLKQLIDSVWTSSTQEEIIAIIEEAKDIAITLYG